ncbi:YveK family protein [uncultured Ligilactobacillus sp.]|uniref:YveK family protein n=3 Tax=uncultured Ligilactobacillus sp. TaxID=2837633 RepID=UPI00272B65DF|nr:Wzz/FepE/Etk N-terminal domain-containing protein [uncultured Ligilactobacillus sp.]
MDKNLQNDGTITLDIRRFNVIMKKNILGIVICGVIGLVLSTIVSTVIMTPKYESSVDILVNQKSSDIQTQLNVQQADLQAINTYKDVLKKPIILSDVLKQLREKDNYQGNLEDLQSSLNITNETNSQVVTVTAKAENPYIAKDIANMVGEVFTNKIKKLMQVNNVTIVSDARLNTTPVSPNRKLIIIVGTILGLFIGIIIGLIKELTNTKISDMSYLTDELGLTNLGTVYHIDNKNKALRVVNIITGKTENSSHNRV